jgi:hypothetical protein
VLIPLKRGDQILPEGSRPEVHQPHQDRVQHGQQAGRGETRVD